MSVKAKIMAGQMLGKSFDKLAQKMGNLARGGAQVAVRAGTDKFMPGIAQEALPAMLRASSTSTIPQAAQALGTLGTYGLGAYAADRVFDAPNQQSSHTQPMRKGSTGNAEMDKFLYHQQLQNQKFRNDMALVQARAEARSPGSQFGPNVYTDMATADLRYSEAGEVTNKEALGVARSIYGTGTRL